MRLMMLGILILTAGPVSPGPAGTWVERGPLSSGRVSAIVATDASHLWAASPGGGVWKTANGGANWTWAGNSGLGDFTVLDLALDRNNPHRMYVRTWNGFLLSIDGGAHWNQTLYSQGPGGDTSNFQPGFACGVFPACPPFASSPLFEPRAFTQMVFSPHQSILLTALPCGGLQYSTNSGASFTQLWPFPGAHPEMNADNCISSIAADEATGKVYFTSMGSGMGDHTHVFRSNAAWTAAGPPAGLRWELVNAGDTWVCPALNQQYVDIRAIHADRNLKRVWIGADQSALETYSVISSYPWTQGAGLGPGSGSTGLGISSWQAYSLAASPTAAHRNRVIVGAQDVSSACSDDGGAHWQLIRSDESQSLVWRRNGNSDVLYSYSTLGTMQRYDNAGSAATCSAITSIAVSPPDSMRGTKGFAGPHTMAVHPTDSKRVFTVSARNVVYSTNSGASWAKFAFNVHGLAKVPALTAIFVDETGVLYVGTQDGGAFTCGDTVHLCDGSSGSGAWAPWGLNPAAGTPPPRMITAITESNPPPAPRTFWMGTSQGLYRKLPGTNAWTQVGTAPGYVYNEVVVDPGCHSRIYTGVGYLDPLSRSRGGVDFSADNGRSWTSLTVGADLHNVPITQVVVMPGAPARVLASTYGRGAWEYDWGPSLPHCVP